MEMEDGVLLVKEGDLSVSLTARLKIAQDARAAALKQKLTREKRQFHG